jgi:ankyrin repeat protein
MKIVCILYLKFQRDNLPLHHAAMKGHADIVQTLLDAGSEINAQEKVTCPKEIIILVKLLPFNNT